MRDEDVEELLLDQSDLEDIGQEYGGDIYSDPEFQPTEERDDTSESDSEPEPESVHDVTVTRPGPARGRTRGSCSSNRGRQGHNIPAQHHSMNTGWSHKNFAPQELEVLQPSYLPNVLEATDMMSLFRQYIDDDIINTIVQCTNRTSVKIHGKSLNLTKAELYMYIGISFVMSTINYPWLRKYWERKWRVAVIADNMPRNRYMQLRNALKFVYDDDIAADARAKDKLWKVRPLIDKIQAGCKRQHKENKLSIDEMIIPFTGSCGIKQYCPGKPNPVGVKAFVLANPNGLVCNFDVYQGNTTYPQFESTSFGLGDKAVLSLAESLVPGHTLYIDRYFTTVKLADRLLQNGIGCTGTIQKNRVPAVARDKLIDDKVLKRRGRGSVSSIVREDDKVAITKWFDNKPVLMLSTVEAKDPEDLCRRWCKRDKRYVDVSRPRVIRNYNAFMGGVDLADRMLSVCPFRYRTRKWTQRFFSHMLDLAVSNSWIQHKNEQITKGVPVKNIQQLRNYKMELGEKIIEQNTEEDSTDSINEEESESILKRKKGRPSTEVPSKKRRQKSSKHMPLHETKQSRCRHCHYNKSRTKCSTCNVFLCLNKQRNCYKEFHE